MASHESKTTTDHQTIKKWTEDRDAKPAKVKGTENNSEGGGILRINFPGGAEDSLENISWDEFFEIFDDRDLEFLYQEKTKDGGESRFFKLVNKND